MPVPQTAEGISRLLRSKSTTTEEIYDLSTKLIDGSVDVYFPHKEAFILQLLVDRWNDQKLTLFKKDYHMWMLFNLMWKRVNSDDHRKRIFKNLKFVPHLIQTWALIDSDLQDFVLILTETFSLINACVTVDIAPEQAQIILAGTLNLLVEAGIEDVQSRTRMVEETIILTDFSEILDLTFKLRKSFVAQLLYPILRYNTTFPNVDLDETTQRLDIYVNTNIFDSQTDTLTLLKKFLNSLESDLTADILVTLFKKSVRFLSKKDFSLLESIFTDIVEIYPSLASEFLEILSASKKTMSQSFLENLFSKVFINSSVPTPESTWLLINRIISLDIEVGILNTTRIMDALSKETITATMVSVWAHLVKCHVNAREFSNFLQHWKKYSADNANSKRFILDDVFTKVISDNIVSLSSSQLKVFMGDLLADIEKDAQDSNVSIQALNVVVCGFYKLPYKVLPEFRSILSKIFEIEHKKTSEFWSLFYRILDIYDDILPANEVQSTKTMIIGELEKQQLSKNFLFAVLKFRELEEFDMLIVSEKLIEFVSQLSAEYQKETLQQIFQRWSTLLNFSFPRSALKKLIELLTQPENIDIIENLTKDDDFFEESNIMYLLVERLVDNLQNESCMKILCSIPIQCINKNIRVGAIDNVMSKRELNNNDIFLLSHLLLNPTFKSQVETDLKVLHKLVSLEKDEFSFANEVFEAVVANHLSQPKESNSADFIKELIAYLNIRITESFDFTIIKMAFYLSKFSSAKSTEMINLKSCLINEMLEKVHELNSAITDNIDLLSWILKALFYMNQESAEIDLSDKLHHMVSELAKILNAFPDMNHDIIANYFLVFCASYNDKLEYLLAHYLVLRQRGINGQKIISGLKVSIQNQLKKGNTGFNAGFRSVISSFRNMDNDYADAVLEVYELFITHLMKENDVGNEMFTESLYEFFTYFEAWKMEKRDPLLRIIETLNSLLTVKPWLFTQHCTETLFPMCLKFNLSCVSKDRNNDDIFVLTNRLLSNVLLYHRYKLSNRHHLIIVFINNMLELISNNAKNGLTELSARSLSRLITNFCEPSNLSKGDKAKAVFNSRVAQVKKSLRRYLPVVLIKYINLSLTSPFEPSVKQELVRCVFAILDVLSHDELEIVNASLDNSGRIYYRALYSEYKRVGKWRDS